MDKYTEEFRWSVIRFRIFYSKDTCTHTNFRMISPHDTSYFNEMDQ